MKIGMKLALYTDRSTVGSAKLLPKTLREKLSSKSVHSETVSNNKYAKVDQVPEVW